MQTKTLVTDEGHETTLDAFLADNADGLDPETLDAVAALAIGETYNQGGGGWAEWSVTRTA